MADAPKILGTDTLRQAYPKLNSAINNSNEALKKSDKAESSANTAITEAQRLGNEAKNIASVAETKADSVQEQFNQVIIDGDSSPAIAQALAGTPYETLREKHEAVDAQITDTSIKTTENKRALNYFWLPEAQPPARTDEPGYFIDAFNLTSDQYITDYFEPLRTANPDYITRSSMGKDASGLYDVWKYEFTPKNYTKTIIISSCMHGGEVTLMVTMLRFLHYLINEWEKYPDLAYVRQSVRIVYVPFVNPWGVSQKPRTRQNSNGVDLNRNFDYKWSQFVGGANPFDHDYKGTAPFSEVEAQYIKTLIESYPDAVSYLDLHNTGSTSKTYFVYLPEKYPYKTYDKLVSYFTRDLTNPVVDLNKNASPTASNYVFSNYSITASHPEWCDVNFGIRQYDATEITSALQWISNVIFEHVREFETKDKPFMKERFYIHTGTNPVNVTAASSASAQSAFLEDINIPSDGFLTFDGFIVVLAGSAATRAMVTPRLGQTGSTPLYGSLNVSRWEAYADISAAERAVIPFSASMPVKKAEGDIGKVGIGLFLYTGGTGSFLVARYRGRITFTPADITNYEVKEITT